MSRRILLAESDASGRAMMDRVLTAEGYAAEAVASVHDARALLGAGAFELAIVDELAGAHAVLEEVRWLRKHYPRLPVVVTGGVLTNRVLVELLRLGVMDVLVKPFLPDELRRAVAGVMARSSAAHVDALEMAAAIATARRAIADGDLEEARLALSRAQATAPFDSEAMALRAYVAELQGDRYDADRGYRAALALRHVEDLPPPDPREGLARLAAASSDGPSRAKG